LEKNLYDKKNSKKFKGGQGSVERALKPAGRQVVNSEWGMTKRLIFQIVKERGMPGNGMPRIAFLELPVPWYSYSMANLPLVWLF
jgi:hypothetical protein